MPERRPYEHKRDLQIMPADGWWAVYAHEDGTITRHRLVAFSLVERWESWRLDDPAPDDSDLPERSVLPMTWSSDGIDHDECENLIGIIHADEWADNEAGLLLEAQEYADGKRAKAAARTATKATP